VIRRGATKIATARSLSHMRPLARGLVADLAMPRKHIEIPPAAARAFVRSAPRHMEEAWTS